MSKAADAPVVPPIKGYPFKKGERKAKPAERSLTKKAPGSQASRLPNKGVFSSKHSSSIITDKDRATKKPLLQSPVHLTSDSEDGTVDDEVLGELGKGNDFAETRTSSGSTSPFIATNPPPQEEHVLRLQVDPGSYAEDAQHSDTQSETVRESVEEAEEDPGAEPAREATPRETEKLRTPSPEQETPPTHPDDRVERRESPERQLETDRTSTTGKKRLKAKKAGTSKRPGAASEGSAGGNTAGGSYPKGFEEYVEEGRKKRQKRRAEQEEQEKVQKSCAAPSFQPSITPFAQRQRKVSSTTAFAALATEWDEQRKRKIRARSEALQAQERDEIERTKFKNKETNRIMSRRGTYTAGARGDTSAARATNAHRESTFERLELDCAKRAANQKRLEQKYTPSFTPERITAATERERSKSVQEVEEGSSAGTHKQNVEEFYTRVMEQRRRSEVKLEKFRQEDLDRAAGMKRSMSEVKSFLDKMEQDELKRRQKLEKKAEALHSQEEAGQTFHPSINSCSEEMAERARQREEVRRAAAAPVKGEEEDDDANRSVPANDKQVNFKEFEARQYRTEEQRQRRMNNLMKEQLENELSECTFRPKLAPRRTPDSSVLRNSLERSPPQQPQINAERYVDHKGPSPLVDPLSRSQLKQLEGPRVPPLPLTQQQERQQKSPSKIREADSNASDISFVGQQMSELEKVLNEWHELEEACS